MLTQQQLLDVLECDPINGKLFWKIPARRRKVGDEAGALRPDGYVQIQINYELHLAHRLMFLATTGVYPTLEIDHINRNRSDNRMVNLRITTRKENGENLSIAKNNSSGFRGVSWDSVRNKWRVQVKHLQKNIFIGRYDSIVDAVNASMEARKFIFTHSQD